MSDLTPTVTLVDGQPCVSSLDIAEKFGKRHDDLLRAIKRVLSDLFEDFRLRNFAESSYINEQGKEQPCYQLTRDGFSLLAMGFTGKKALAWKVKYIEAFNAMEAELLKKTKPAPRQRRPRKALPAPEQLALPTPKKDKFEAYIEQVEEFRAKTEAERSRLLNEGLRLVDVYKFGPEGIVGFAGIFSSWLYDVTVSATPLVASYWSMEHAIEHSPLYLIREMEKRLPHYRRK